MKRFKKQSHLIKYAIHSVLQRQKKDAKDHVSLLRTTGDFLQKCKAKILLPK